MLLFNDFFLKFSWPGIISGKLSDFAGISLFSLFLFALLPKRKLLLSIFIIFAFSWWKSEWSESFIILVRQAGLYHFNRVIDLSDLLALIMVPVCYRYANASEVRHRNNLEHHGSAPVADNRIIRIGIIALSLFAITATSQIPGSYRSEFTIEQQSESKISSGLAVLTVDRILSYYGYKCTTNCDTQLNREYKDSRGRVIYNLDATTGLISIKQTITPDQGMIDFFKRDDIKHMRDIRTQITDQLKKENKNIEYDVKVAPRRYSH